jgi:Fic family protein
MTNNRVGKLVTQPQGFKAFVPNTFPPPGGFTFENSTINKAGLATLLVGKLDGITKLLPDLDFFLLMYLRKDAAASSQIEGTMATMIDAIEAEVQTKNSIPTDVDDILHYIRALRYGMNRVKKDDFPLGLRFICELHKQLMEHARHTHFADPGELRKSQNWISGTKPDNAKFVPPPVIEMNRAISDLEKYIHATDDLLPIIKAGLLHAQFETIHPFLDGNGRTGRMLITFYLWYARFLENPVLFLSTYFKQYQELYYQKLSDYHNGDIESWINFFLDGVIEIAEEAIYTVDRITILREKVSQKIQKLGKRSAESATKIIPKLYAQPIVNVSVIQAWTNFSRVGATTVIVRLIDLGILIPKDSDIKYGQSYMFKEYLDIFSTR